MVSLFGGIVETLLVLIASLALAALVWDYWNERDLERSVQKSSRRAAGLVTGAGAVSIGAIAPWAEIMWQLPEMLIALFGALALVQGFSVEVYLAGSVVIYVVAEAINGGPRAA